jgi:hypothetical protein
VGYNISMGTVLPPELATDLAAACAARTGIHFDICTIYSEGPEYGCSCGVPRLLAAMATLFGVFEDGPLMAAQKR